jgi:molybdopterin converting factor small subunit
MRVEVLLFGAERDAAGCERAAVEVPERATCAQVRERLGGVFPVLKPHLAAARFAVNGEFASMDRAIGAGDEVALIGLVSGG